MGKHFKPYIYLDKDDKDDDANRDDDDDCFIFLNSMLICKTVRLLKMCMTDLICTTISSFILRIEWSPSGWRAVTN